MIETPYEIRELSGCAVAPTLRIYARVGSTNTLALTMSEEIRGNAAFLADEQTAGRGQYERTWVAPPRSGVLLSLLLRPPVTMRRPVVLTAWIAVAVRDVVAAVVGERVRLKWPNDVYVGGRKIAGILVESVARAGDPVFVVGVGLNVTQSREDFDGAGLANATSLNAEGASATTHEFAERLIRAADALCPVGAELEARWAEAFGLLATEVEAVGGDGRYRGRLTEMSFEMIRVGGEGLRPESVRSLSPA